MLRAWPSRLVQASNAWRFKGTGAGGGAPEEKGGEHEKPHRPACGAQLAPPEPAGRPFQSRVNLNLAQRQLGGLLLLLDP